MQQSGPGGATETFARPTEVGGPAAVRADLHVHTSYSKDGAMTPARLVAAALRKGLTCLAVTDHNSLAGGLELAGHQPLQIIVGEEVRSVAGEITGLFLQEAIPKGLAPLEVVKLIKEQGGLVYIPHPFDRFRGSVLRPTALREILPYIDIIEAYNSRNLLAVDNARALRFAIEHNLAVGGGSDAHVSYEVGRTVVEMAAFSGPQEFLANLRAATVLSRRSPAVVHFASTWNKFWRRFGAPVP
jgi:predicted metal-dependent phosphoesterase TrpH